MIPKDYVGSVVIVYGQSTGIPLEIGGNTIVFKIPADGILRIRDAYPNETGWRGLHYYYVDSDGKTQELRRRVKGNELGVFGESVGTTVVDIDGRATAVTYETYVVGRPASRREWDSIEGAVRRAFRQR